MRCLLNLDTVQGSWPVYEQERHSLVCLIRKGMKFTSTYWKLGVYEYQTFNCNLTSEERIPFKRKDADFRHSF